MWPTVSMLQNEYNIGWLDDEGLAAYIGLGLLSKEQYNQIIGKSVSSEASNVTSASTNSGNSSQTSSSSFNPVK